MVVPLLGTTLEVEDSPGMVWRPTAPSRLPPKPAPSPAAVPLPDPAPALAVAARPRAMAWSVIAAANDQVIAKAFWFSSIHLTQN